MTSPTNTKSMQIPTWAFRPHPSGIELFVGSWIALPLRMELGVAGGTHRGAVVVSATNIEKVRQYLWEYATNRMEPVPPSERAAYKQALLRLERAEGSLIPVQCEACPAKIPEAEADCVPEHGPAVLCPACAQAVRGLMMRAEALRDGAQRGYSGRPGELQPSAMTARRRSYVRAHMATGGSRSAAESSAARIIRDSQGEPSKPEGGE